MFNTEEEVIDYCKYIIQCLADNKYKELESKGILETVSEIDIKRVINEYAEDSRITVPADDQYMGRIDIFKYNDNTGYAVDIDIYLNNELSDLTLQVEILYSGKVTIEDLHVL